MILLKGQLDDLRCASREGFRRRAVRVRRPEAALLDIDTQLDFFWRRGSRYVPAASEVAVAIRRLFHWAWSMRIPVISTVLRVRQQETWLHGPVPYCVEDTKGERKLPGTVLARYLDLGLRNTTDLPVGLLRRYQQVIFERRATNIFLHAGLERLVTELGCATFIVCGATLSDAVLQAALGLRHRGAGVLLVTDAVLDLNGAPEGMTYRRLEAKGVVLIPASRIIALKTVGEIVGFSRSKDGPEPAENPTGESTI